MMKTQHLLPLLLLSALASCRTEVKYNGEITQPKFVVFAQTDIRPAGQRNICYVQQSTFFLDDEPSGKMLDDATVEWQLNDGARSPFVFVADSGAYLPCSPLPQAVAGDRITMHVTHPLYGATTASQIIPFLPPVQTDSLHAETDTLSEYTEQVDDSLVHIVGTRQRITLRLIFPPYAYNDGDVIGLTARAVYHPAPDSVYRRKAYLSSSDPLFRLLTTETDLGIIDDIASLFGDEVRRYNALYFPVSAVGKGHTTSVTFFTPQYDMLPDSLLLTVRAMTNDAWLYRVSIEQQSSGSILGLGQEEKVQVYGNFTGDVIGVFITSAKQTCGLDLTSTKEGMENEKNSGK